MFFTLCYNRVIVELRDCNTSVDLWIQKDYSFLLFFYYFNKLLILIREDVVAQRQKRVNVWVRFLFEEIKYLLYWFVRSGVEVQARRWVTPLNTQCLLNSAESGEWRVSTLGSLYLPCYMRDPLWSWETIIYMA